MTLVFNNVIKNESTVRDSRASFIHSSMTISWWKPPWKIKRLECLGLGVWHQVSGKSWRCFWE